MTKYFRLLVILIGLHTATVLHGQDTTMIWYDAKWDQTTEADAEYYRKAWLENDLWMVRDYFKDGSLQMTGSFCSLDPKVKHGAFVYYNKNGNKTSEGRYAENIKVGPWSKWYADGTLRDSGSYKHVNPYLKGNCDPESTFHDPGVPDTLSISNGEWKYFHENGNISSRIIYEDNKPVSIEYWKDDGTVITDNLVYERMPEFPGGAQALMHFLGNNVSYPEADKKAGIAGEVLIRFVVDVDGKVVDPVIVNSVSPGIDAACIRVVNSMPNWTPGFQNNQPVKVMYNLPIRFKTQAPKEKNKKSKRRI